MAMIEQGLHRAHGGHTALGHLVLFEALHLDAQSARKARLLRDLRQAKGRRQPNMGACRAAEPRSGCETCAPGT